LQLSEDQRQHLAGISATAAVTQEVEFVLRPLHEIGDNFTVQHGDRVGAIAAAIGMAMRLDEVSLLLLGRGGKVHDIGKLHPDVQAIIHTPGMLNDEEQAVIATHPERGVRLAATAGLGKDTQYIIGMHHTYQQRAYGEVVDLSGYTPRAQARIRTCSHIVAVADVYDAVRSRRPYKDEQSVERSLAVVYGLASETRLAADALARLVAPKAA
jgi:cyclic di-GMP phosphodiesterase